MHFNGTTQKLPSIYSETHSLKRVAARQQMLKSFAFAVTSAAGEDIDISSDFSELIGVARKDLSRVIVEKFTLDEYSSSSATSIAMVVSGPLGKWVNTISALGTGNCMAVLMPFAHGAAVRGPDSLGTPSAIADPAGVGIKYRNFVRRRNDGWYDIDYTAPFAHRLSPGIDGGRQRACVPESDMMEAMTSHEELDHILDLSDGFSLAMNALEDGSRGPLRLVFTIVLTLLPAPLEIFAPVQKEDGSIEADAKII